MTKVKHLVSFEYNLDKTMGFDENMKEIVKHIKDATKSEQTFRLTLQVEVDNGFEKEVDQMIKMAHELLETHQDFGNKVLVPHCIDKDGETLYKRAKA